MFRFSKAFLQQSAKMGVVKTTINPGTGAQPTKGQTVTIEYTGWLKDATKENGRGKQYDS